MAIPAGFWRQTGFRRRRAPRQCTPAEPGNAGCAMRAAWREGGVQGLEGNFRERGQPQIHGDPNRRRAYSSVGVFLFPLIPVAQLFAALASGTLAGRMAATDITFGVTLCQTDGDDVSASAGNPLTRDDAAICHILCALAAATSHALAVGGFVVSAPAEIAFGIALSRKKSLPLSYSAKLFPSAREPPRRCQCPGCGWLHGGA